MVAKRPSKKSARTAQEVARLREEADLGIKLQVALATDPIATINLLQQRYAQQQQAPPPEPEFDDPLEKMLHEERQARMALEQRITQREEDERLNQMVGTLRSQFNANDEDIRTAIVTAAQQQLPVETVSYTHLTLPTILRV